MTLDDLPNYLPLLRTIASNLIARGAVKGWEYHDTLSECYVQAAGIVHKHDPKRGRPATFLKLQVPHLVIHEYLTNWCCRRCRRVNGNQRDYYTTTIAFTPEMDPPAPNGHRWSDERIDLDPIAYDGLVPYAQLLALGYNVRQSARILGVSDATAFTQVNLLRNLLTAWGHDRSIQGRGRKPTGGLHHGREAPPREAAGHPSG